MALDLQYPVTVSQVPGHNPVRYWVRGDGCWEWLSNKTKAKGGYGRISRGGKMVLAHRFMYERAKGPIPDGLTLDHLCRNRLCVNPGHLEPVTLRENALRGVGPTAINARKTHCIRGHRLNEKNTYTKTGGRSCRACVNARAAEKRPARPTTCAWCGKEIHQAASGRIRRYCSPTHAVAARRSGKRTYGDCR